MSRQCFLAAFAAVAVWLPASAQGTAPLNEMSAADIEATFFGVDMSGVTYSFGEPWRECIEPSGETVYHFMGETRIGRAWVNENAQLCFVYPADETGDTPACFQAFKRGLDYIFYSEFNGVFIADLVTPGVETCPRDIPVG